MVHWSFLLLGLRVNMAGRNTLISRQLRSKEGDKAESQHPLHRAPHCPDSFLAQLLISPGAPQAGNENLTCCSNHRQQHKGPMIPDITSFNSDGKGPIFPWWGGLIAWQLSHFCVGNSHFYIALKIGEAYHGRVSITSISMDTLHASWKCFLKHFPFRN